jgi:hypothetical protein
MKKVIKKYGNSYVLILSPEEMDIYSLKEGDVIDIGDLTRVKKRGGK